MNSPTVLTEREILFGFVIAENFPNTDIRTQAFEQPAPQSTGGPVQCVVSYRDQ